MTKRTVLKGEARNYMAGQIEEVPINHIKWPQVMEMVGQKVCVAFALGNKKKLRKGTVMVRQPEYWDDYSNPFVYGCPTYYVRLSNPL